jgi:lactate dehydrogenase-like 2-hydroxyacid dehydrogenase
MTRIVVAEVSENTGRELDIERSILGPDVEVEHYVCDGDEDHLIAACENADAVLTDYSPFTRRVLGQLRNTKLISVAATGYDCVDLDAAAETGIRVCAIDEYCTDEVADHAILLMLALCRRLPEYHEQVQKEHRWQFDSLAGLARMSDLTLGIVGFGKIGQAIAKRALGFGMTVLAQDPYPDEQAARALGVRLCELQELYADSNIISLNCGLTPDNQQMINADAIALMLRKPIIINCARGALVDEAALINALDSGQISGAGLDVLDDESPDLRSSNLIGRSNVILTPHVAFYSDASILDNRRISTSNIKYYLEGNHDEVRRYVL